MPNGMHDGHRARMDEKVAKYGLEALSEHEQLEYMLFDVIPRANTNHIAHNLLEEFKSLAGVFSATPKELEKIEGIGARSAKYLSTQYERAGIVQRSLFKKGERYIKTEDLGNYAISIMIDKKMEAFYLISMDTMDRVITYDKIADGTIDEVPVYKRRVVKKALDNHASAVVLVHNHTSLILKPSPEDITLTKDIYKALNAAGVKLKDHIITGDYNYYSMAAEGVIDRLSALS